MMLATKKPVKGTADEVWARRQEIRSCLVGGMRPEEIVGGLGISRATLFRDLHEIRKEDSEWIEELVKDELAHAYRLVIDSLREDRKRLTVISESAKNDKDKIEAIRLAGETSVNIIELLAQGPTVVALKRMKESRIPMESQ